MEQKMYIGPNIPVLGLVRNQVFIDDYPGQVKVAMFKIPEIEELIVPIDEITDSIAKTRTKGTKLYHLYNLVQEKAAAKK